MTQPMQINFGQPSADQVVGRDDVLNEIRRAITRGSSVILTGERRIGKSWVLKALVQDPPPGGWIAVYTDVEQIQRISDLHEVLAERLVQQLPLARRAIERLLTSDITDIKGVPIPHAPGLEPVDRLRRLVRGVAASGQRLILVLDELPILAQRLEAGQPGEALVLLQLLRALRMEEDNLRMVLAGSIGLHHLLHGQAEIRAAVNDLLPVAIGPLDPDEARTLTFRLLQGIGVHEVSGPTLDSIVAGTDGVPFYIQHLVAGLEQRRDGVIDAAAVAEVRRNALYGPDDPWQLRHYEARLPEYFGPDTPLALACLDAIAARDDGLTLAEILDRVRGHRELESEAITDEGVRDVTERLRLDHYLTLHPETLHLAFSLGVVRDAWRALRFR